MLLVEGQRQRQEMGHQVQAQGMHHPLAQLFHDHHLGILETIGQNQDHQQQ